MRTQNYGPLSKAIDVNQAGHFSGALQVLAISDKGIQCATLASPEASFWLPRAGSHVIWVHPPKVGELETAIVPGWLAAKHRQLAGDVVFERVRAGLRQSRRPNERRSIAKEQRMNDKSADVGSGALFKNDRKEKPTHPDYRGDVTIYGPKLWVSAWLKQGQKGKYMSLAFRPVEEKSDKPAPAALAAAHAPVNDDIPF